jgi:hypothetical protein
MNLDSHIVRQNEDHNRHGGVGVQIRRGGFKAGDKTKKVGYENEEADGGNKGEELLAFMAMVSVTRESNPPITTSMKLWNEPGSNLHATP